MRLTLLTLLAALPYLTGCSCSTDEDDKDAARDASTDGPYDSGEAGPDADGGRQCTSIFSEPAGSPSPAPSAVSSGTGEMLPNPGNLTENTTLFPFAVQAGEMTPSGAVLWTRVTDLEGAALSVRVWPEADRDGSEVEVVAQGAASVEEGGFVHYPVTGLEAGVSYLYAFGTFSDESPVRSAVGRFRTAFANGEQLQLKVAALTCTGAFAKAADEAVKPYPALSEMAKTEVDAILHLGDISYNDGSRSLGEFHAEWEETLSQQGYLDLLPSAGMYAIWDDHEIDNAWNAETPAENVRTTGRTAFNQFLATARTGNDPLWTSYRWGDSAEFFLLDTRSERLPSTRETDDPIFISKEQLAWLQTSLRDSTAHFKVVMTSVTMANMHGEWDTTFARNDRWEGYEAQREALLDFIVDNDIDNVWFLAGDIHSGYVGRLEKEGHRYARMWEIVVGPGASNANPIPLTIESGLIKAQDVYPCEQYVYFHGRQQVETYLTFDPGSDTVRVQLEDGLTGETMYDAALRQEPRSE